MARSIVFALIWFATALCFMLVPMPPTWLDRSANLFGTMLCSLLFGFELRIIVDRWQRRHALVAKKSERMKENGNA